MNDSSLHVMLQRCETYDRTAIASLINKIVAPLGISDQLYGNVVLLKPNLISSIGPSLACTHGEFIAGVASWFIEQGAKVLVGDSPAFGSAAKVCQKQGIVQALAGMDVKIVDFITPFKRQLATGVTITIAREALECDLFVGLPKIKAHNQMYVTLAVKNIFGIVKGVNKGMLHMVQGESHSRFAEIILDLVSILPSQLHLVDGIEVMHKSGPIDGSPLPLGCIAGARCPVALDSALLALLDLDQAKSPLWRIALASGKYVGSADDKIIYPQMSPQDFHGSGFIAPDHLESIRFNPVGFLSGMVKRALLRLTIAS